MTTKRVTWIGPQVHVVRAEVGTPNDHLDVRVSAGTAGMLANTVRLAVQVLGERVDRQPALVELLAALDYVMVGDPASVAAHRRMEAGKGMDPSESTPPRS